MKQRIPAIPAAALTILALCAPLAAQRGFDSDDERDTITLKNGKEIRGRVQQRHDPEEILIRQGSKRVRVKPDRVAKLDTVRDRLRDFFVTKEGRDHTDAETHWELSEWAQDNKLPHLARVAAYATLTRDADHADAHEFLGHRKRGKSWRWKIESRYLPRDRFEEYTSDIGHGLELRSEHFVILTDAGLRKTCNALYDLERLYLWWLDEYGEPMRLEEALVPIKLKIFDHETSFPALSSQKLPYFVPFPHDDQSYLFYEEKEERPEMLFTIATQHLLYRTLVKDASVQEPQDRFCAWLEFGLSQWAESRFHGDPGVVEPGEVKLDAREVALAASDDRYSLKNMLHLHVRDHFYATGSIRRYGSGRRHRATTYDVHWAATQMFVTFLLDEKANPGLGKRVWEYARIALGEGKGDSSSAFDDAIGHEIESFEKPWARWVTQQSGVPSRPK